MPDLSQSFVASLARALNTAQVPCILWGHCLLSLHGVPSVIGSIDFVIPDDCLGAAARALAQCDGLVPCPDPPSCPATSKERHTQPPVFHAHLDGNLEVTAGLYFQSGTLWFLPPLDHSMLFPSSSLDLPPYFALASDRTIFPPWRPGRGAGVFKSAADAVIAPRSHILLEAYMRLYARDQGKRIGSFGIAMIAYMQLYVDADGFLDADLLPEPLRTSYRELQEGKKPIRQWMLELKDALGVAEEEPQSDEGY
ncbi:Thioredoxin reductase [Coniochaeta hoffmannii]|uniref:Thioredoxin reductase n=1 Tax=Coniochaeta hoffmannii TaxID=91930 RepID=A0AA38VMA2_9PEZI|nr:Thioredoxin reductase [Coniochaeta hoffmannii]